MLWVKIGDTAGKVHALLLKKKVATPKEMLKELKVPYDLLQMSLGWLAREGKIKFEKVRNTLKISMK
jgi:transcription initiation factor IIE alpha subunit